MLKRSVLTVLVILGATFLLIIFTARVPAGPPANMPRGNGDVNGDGFINISDATYILVYLFRNGMPPIAIASTSEFAEEKLASIDSQLMQTNEKLDAIVSAFGGLSAVEDYEHRISIEGFR